MRKSKLLGITGGISSILFAVVYVLIDFTTASSTSFDLKLTDPQTLLFCCIAASGGVLGIIGGFISVKKKILGGIIMIISAAASIVSVTGVLATAILIIGGVQAFIYKEQDSTNIKESGDVKNKKVSWVSGLIIIPAIAFLAVIQNILIIILRYSLNLPYSDDLQFYTSIFLYVTFFLGSIYALILNKLYNKDKNGSVKKETL